MASSLSDIMASVGSCAQPLAAEEPRLTLRRPNPARISTRLDASLHIEGFIDFTLCSSDRRPSCLVSSTYTSHLRLLVPLPNNMSTDAQLQDEIAEAFGEHVRQDSALMDECVFLADQRPLLG